jgi:hypothetical protein
MRIEMALARWRISFQLGGGPDRSRHEVAAAIGTASLEHALDAVSAKRAFERADHGVARSRRQIAIAALATRFE